MEYIKIYPEADLHAFEPNVPFFKELIEASKKTEGTGHIYLSNHGLGDKEDKVFYDPNRQAFWGGECPVNTKFVELPIKTLDWYVEKHGIKQIDFLKIDAEGYDYKVLLGGKEALKNTRYIQYEHWDNKGQFHDLLGKDFDMEYIGYRNVLCMSKTLVSPEIREEIIKFIRDNKFGELV